MARRSIPYITFLILAAVLLWPLAAGKVLLPASMLGHVSPWQELSQAGPRDVHWNALTWDGISYFYPARKLLGESLRRGELPLWNPYQMCGMPFLASPQSAVLYPPNWLFAVLPTDRTFGLLAFLHLFAAGSFTYLFLRKLGLGTEASVFGGVAFMLSGWTVVWLELPVLLASGVWLPLTLYLCTVAFEKRSALHAGLAGLTLAFSLFGGHPQIWFYVLLATGLYWIYLIAGGYKRTPILPAAGLAVICFGLGFLMAAPQLLPTMELAALSHRGGSVPTGDGYQAYVALAMPWRALIGLLTPDFYGNPTAGSYWGTGEYAEFTGYVGLLPLLLVPFAFVGRGRRNAGFFAALAILSLLMATGTAVDRVFYFGIPGFSSSGSPARILCLYTFCIAVLGAMGLDRMLAAKRRLTHLGIASAAFLFVLGVVLFFVNAGFVAEMASVSAADLLSSAYVPVVTGLIFLVIGLAVAVLGASGRMKSSVAGWMAVGLLAIDLLVFGQGYNLYSSRSQVYPETKAIRELERLAGPGRIMPMNTQWRLREFPRAILPPNAGTAYGMFDVQGYDSLYPVRYKHLLDAAAGRDTCPPENGNMVFARNLDSSLWDLLGVRYFVLSKKHSNSLELSEHSYAFKNKESLPRAILVHRTRRTPDQESLELLARGGVDLRSVALVDENPPIVESLGSALSGVVLLRRSTCNTLTIDVDNPHSPGLLVVTDQFYPGWTARIGDRRLPVIRTDYCFRGVAVPQGRHQVVFSFEPQSLRRGLVMALTGLLIIAGTAVASVLRSRGGAR